MDNLKKAFVDNFQSSFQRAGTRHNLAQCKQGTNENLRTYTQCFFKTRATIVNFSDRDVIDCLHNGLYERAIYRDFGRNCPKTVADLCDMMHSWADQEDQEQECYSRRCGDNQNRWNDNHRNDNRS
jgi:hypothetical protein